MDTLLTLPGTPEPPPEHECAGVDEAGRGCLAGPVVAAAVLLPPGFALDGLTDSKQLTAEAREALEPVIRTRATAWSVGVVWPWVIDEVNILQATFRAMAGAVLRLGLRPRLVLVDGDKTVPMLGLPQRAIIGGDGLKPSISAASILAKTHRDRVMARLDARYPGYGFAAHKGYATRAHYAALEQLGPCRMHRMSFRGVLPETRREKAAWPGTLT